MKDDLNFLENGRHLMFLSMEDFKKLMQPETLKISSNTNTIPALQYCIANNTASLVHL